MRSVLGVETGFVDVEAVGVLHGELAGPDQTGTRTGIVAPLDLDLEHELGKLAIRADLPGGQARHHLLVGHGEHHVPVAAVLKTRQLGADLLESATLLPELSRVHDGKRHLDGADGGHLLPEDLLDVLHGLPSERQVGEDALAELAYITRPEEELVADRLDPGGRLSQRLTEHLGHPHRKSLLLAVGENLLGRRVRAPTMAAARYLTPCATPHLTC